MEFIQVAYCLTVPLLLLLIVFAKKEIRGYSKNLLAVSNILLIGHSLFLIRQLLGFYSLLKQYGEIPATQQKLDVDAIRLLALIILPFLSLIGPLRRNIFFSAVLMVLLYWHHPYFTWNMFNLPVKIPYYISLVCTTYALLWLIKQLPYPKRK